jgi:hypothetical protein
MALISHFPLHLRAARSLIIRRDAVLFCFIQRRMRVKLFRALHS